MNISVIIPVYNESASIGSCICSLLAQTVPLELILVDDGSADKSVTIIQRFAKHHRSIKFRKQSHAGPAAARNAGAEIAKGEVYVFVDADMTFAHDFIEVLTQPILKGKSNGTFTKTEYVSNWENVWARCWNYNQGLRSQNRIPQNYPNQAPVFRAIKAREFKRIGGYNCGVGWVDDWTLSQKLGYLSDATSAVSMHANPDSLFEVNTHAYWIGKSVHISGGALRILINMLRYSPLTSLFSGIFGSFWFMEPRFILFKFSYDAGIFRGIIDVIKGFDRNK